MKQDHASETEEMVRQPGQAEVRRWVELRDAQGKLQAKYDPVGNVLEIKARGVKTRYALNAVASDNPDLDIH